MQQFASLCSTTRCRPLSRGVKRLRSHLRGPGGRSMQDRASELPRTPLLGRWVHKGLLSVAEVAPLVRVLDRAAAVRHQRDGAVLGTTRVQYRRLGWRRGRSGRRAGRSRGSAGRSRGSRCRGLPSWAMREVLAGHTLLSREGFPYWPVQAVGVARVLLVDPLRILLIGEVRRRAVVAGRVLCEGRSGGLYHVL